MWLVREAGRDVAEGSARGLAEGQARRRRSADLMGAKMQQAHLIDANLRGANLSGTHQITQAQLDQACGTVKLDPGLTIKPCQPQ